MQLFPGLLSNPPVPSFNVRGRWSSVHHPTLTSLNHTFPYRLNPFPSFQTLLPFFFFFSFSFFLSLTQVLLDWDTPAAQTALLPECCYSTHQSALSQRAMPDLFTGLCGPRDLQMHLRKYWSVRSVRKCRSFQVSHQSRCEEHLSTHSVSLCVLDMTLTSLTLLGWRLAFCGRCGTRAAG